MTRQSTVNEHHISSISAPLTEFLEGGSALIVATVGDDGAPHATRGWGLRVLSRRARRVRVLLAAGDQALTHLADGSAVAVTAADVVTLSSVQLKGRSLGIAGATSADRLRAQRYTDAFFGDIEETDGTPREVLDQLVPMSYEAVELVVDEVFDQTPGPGAGAPIEASA